jgi:hypothetical protein
MDLVAYTGSFLLGGVSALMILGLLFHFLNHPRKRVRDDQFLQEIADALMLGPACQRPAEMLQVQGAETSETPGISPEKSFPPGHPAAVPRVGMAYAPVTELH